MVPYLVQEEVAFAGYSATDVDQAYGVDSHGASDVDEVLADPDASAQGENLAARASHVEAETVELEAEVATSTDQTDALLARVAAEFATEVDVRDRGVATESNDYSAI